jgi:hypothetical protein
MTTANNLVIIFLVLLLTNLLSSGIFCIIANTDILLLLPSLQSLMFQHVSTFQLMTWFGSLPTVKMLIEGGADVNVKTRRGAVTPLHCIGIAARWPKCS